MRHTLNKVTKAQVRATIKKTGAWTGLVVPCKMSPHSAWANQVPYTFNEAMLAEQLLSEQGYIKEGQTVVTGLDNWISSFKYYNCNSEMGRYPAFYEITR